VSEDQDHDIAALEQLLRDQPRKADAWVALAEYRWEERRYADALGHLDQAIRASRDREQVLQCYLTKGDLLLDAFPDRAADHYRFAADLDPGRVEPHVRLGLLALRDGQLDIARTEAANCSLQARAQSAEARVLAAVLGELVASHADFELKTFTRRLVRRMDAAGTSRTDDLARFLKTLHAAEPPSLGDAMTAAWSLLLRMVPLFWGGSGGERDLVLPAVARALIRRDCIDAPVTWLEG
jgi:tetratricopeptide (TPR) repeat protein